MRLDMYEKIKAKVMKTVKCLKSWLDFYNRKKGLFCPHEELLETINLGTAKDKREVKMGANLKPNVKEHLVQLLNEYVEIFAWSYEDMLGLDTDIVVHRLPTREDCPPINKKFAE